MEDKIRILAQKHLLQEDEQPWLVYLRTFQPQYYNLIEMLNGNYRTSIKKRAVFAILLPEKCNQQLWQHYPASSSLYTPPYRSRFLQEETAIGNELLVFAGQVLADFSEVVRNHKRQNHFETVPEYALAIYGHYQLQLLTRLSPSEGERVFAAWLKNLDAVHCKEKKEYNSMAYQDGYRLFRYILGFEGLSEQYKRRADQHMREIIGLEQQGNRFVAGVDALESYVRAIQLLDRKGYCRELSVAQLKFALDRTLAHGKTAVFDDRWFHKVLELLNDEPEYLVKLVSGKLSQGLDVQSANHLFIALNLLQDLPEGKIEVRGLLEEFVRAAQQQAAEYDREQRKKTEEERRERERVRQALQ